MISVYGIKEQLNPVKELLSDTINKCMQKVLKFPGNKRSHRFFPMDKQDFYYPEERSNAYIFIEINMMKGRQPETLRTLIRSLFQDIESAVGIAPRDVEIVITEQPAYCWGFRGMVGDEAKLTYKVEV